MEKREESSLSKTLIEGRDLGKKGEGGLLKGTEELSTEEYNQALYAMDSHYFPSYGTEPCVTTSQTHRTVTKDECMKNGGHH